jgi:short-subunit dehydrogenase
MVLIAHGSLTNQCIASENPEYFWHQLETNAISPMLFAELWSQVLIRQEGGHLAVIGSVAGDRGRAINYAYGAAKSGLETYVAGLQHRTQGTGVFVSFVKPGPTRTPMTEHAHVGPTRLADPRKVARIIVKKLSKGARTIYAPRIWLYIMLVIKLLPFSIFKKIKF